MNKLSKLKVYFLGSGSIGIATLKILVNSKNIELIGVGTQPDKPKGRKKNLTPSPIGKIARDLELLVHKPLSVNSSESLSAIKNLKPDIILVYAFGQILKKELLELPKYMCVNIHASILPKYRGASPLNAVILNNEKKTGISIIEMEKGLDSGPVFKKIEFPLSNNETTLSLEEKISAISAKNIENILLEIANGNLQGLAQNHNEASYVSKIYKTDGLINWNEPADVLERKCRAFNPWPLLYFNLNTGKQTKRVQITKCSVLICVDINSPGTILQADKKAWIVACKNSSLKIEKVIPAGKKEMTYAEFLCGHKLVQGTGLI